jgi:hypothetical protein
MTRVIMTDGWVKDRWWLRFQTKKFYDQGETVHLIGRKKGGWTTVGNREWKGERALPFFVTSPSLPSKC